LIYASKQQQQQEVSKSQIIPAMYQQTNEQTQQLFRSFLQLLAKQLLLLSAAAVE